MPNYRRAAIDGGTYFFTVVTHRRQPILTSDAGRQGLRDALHTCRQLRPFQIDAFVLLPDHIHAIWTLPPRDHDFSSRWGVIKAEFTKAWLAAGESEGEVTAAQMNDRRRGVWQPRFWEHAIEDESDFDAHMDYVHYNPVKHNHVRCPQEWKWSSIHRWIRAGVYPENWACGETDFEPDFRSIEHSIAE